MTDKSTDHIALAREVGADVHEGYDDGYSATFSHAELVAFAARIAKAAPEDDRTRLLQYIVDLSDGWDEQGSLGPKKPYSWESVARMAMDYAREALSVAPIAPAQDRDDAQRWRHLVENMTFYNTAESSGPVLASVSKRIWYHATDDLSYPLSAVVDEARQAPKEPEA